MALTGKPANKPRYRVMAPLAEGGTAEVHLAVLDQSSGFQKLTVLKSLRDTMSRDPELVNMFLDEARIAARLKHPNVVEVYEIVEDHGQPVLAMEYLEGGSLRELIAQTGRNGNPLPLVHHLEILCQVGRGLHYSHELIDYDGTHMGLVHRDISPHNIFATVEGEIKILDFGIAKVSGRDADALSGVVKGKLRYMAPEQMLGTKVDRRADIYSLGLLLWEAISGRPMWDTSGQAVIMQRTINGDLPDPEPLVPGCTPGLVAVMRRATEADPGARFETCEDFVAELRREMRSLPAPVAGLGEVVRRCFSDRAKRVRDVVSAQLTSDGRSPDASDTIDWARVGRITKPAPRGIRVGSLGAGLVAAAVGLFAVVAGLLTQCG